MPDGTTASLRVSHWLQNISNFLEATAGLLAVQGEAVDYVVVDSNGVADVIANDVAAGEQIPNVEFVRVVSGVTL